LSSRAWRGNLAINVQTPGACFVTVFLAMTNYPVLPYD
jgi:hypothetical protein